MDDGLTPGTTVREADDGAVPQRLDLHFAKVFDLARGSAPGRAAALYRFDGACPDFGPSGPSVAAARRVNGAPPSWETLLDAAAAWGAVRLFDGPAFAAFARGVPCAAAVASTPISACDAALACGFVPDAARCGVAGAVVAVNRPVIPAFVERLFAAGWPIAGLVAPSFKPDALLMLGTHRDVCALATGVGQGVGPGLALHPLDGGMVVERTRTDASGGMGPHSGCPTARVPSEGEASDARFAARIVSTARSNAVAVVRDGTLLGMGAGQLDVADAARVALRHAADACARSGIVPDGLVCACDAMCPPPDVVEELAAGGVACIAVPTCAHAALQAAARACDACGAALAVLEGTGVLR